MFKEENKQLREFNINDVEVKFDISDLTGRAYMQSCYVRKICLSDKYFHNGILVEIRENENRNRSGETRIFHFQVEDDKVLIRYVNRGTDKTKGDGYFYSQSIQHPNGSEAENPLKKLSYDLAYSEAFAKKLIKALKDFRAVADEAKSKLISEISEHNNKIRQEEKEKEERRREYEKLRREFGN
jgi:hypothetical protein